MKIEPKFIGRTRVTGGKWVGMTPGGFVGGLAPVWTGTACAFIDAQGRTIIEGDFDLAWDFSEERALIWRRKKLGFINNKGETPIEPIFTYGNSFSEGLASVSIGVGANMRAGFIDRQGKWIIEPRFLSAYDFRNGLAFAETEESIGYINSEGSFVWEGPFVEFPRISS